MPPILTYLSYFLLICGKIPSAMKNLLIALTLLLAPVALEAQTASSMQPITLNKPNLQRGESIMQALSKRQSTRQFDARELSVADLSDLLWAANGVNRPDGKRTAPSAMNRQEIEVYVCLKGGSYLYDAKAHKLIPLTATDARPVKTAPLCVILVGPADFQFSAVDAGIVSENISLFCAGVGIATVPQASFNEAELKTALKLDAGKKVFLSHPTGYFVK